MRALIVLLIGVVAFAAGTLLGFKLDSDERTAAPAETTALPAAVETTRAALLAAAESGDYEQLRPLIPETAFEYTFGGAVPGGPIAFWQEIERETASRPIESLAEILKLPYVLSRGYYVWPWAFALESRQDLSPHEVELLAPLGPPSRFFPEGIGYLGWRAGIEADGTWAFFIAGD